VGACVCVWVFVVCLYVCVCLCMYALSTYIDPHIHTCTHIRAGEVQHKQTKGQYAEAFLPHRAAAQAPVHEYLGLFVRADSASFPLLFPALSVNLVHD
jgi:hypothetical protein